MKVCKFIVLAVFLFTSTAQASSLGLSVIDSQGNTNKQSISVDADHKIESEDKRNTQELKGGLFYGESEWKRDAESWYASLKDSHILDNTGEVSPYWFNLSGVKADKFSGVDFELSFNAGMGANLKTEKHDIKLEAGPGLVYEERIDGDHGFITYRAFESWDWKITNRIRLTEEAEYVAPYEDQDDYRVAGECGFVGMINDYLSVKVGPKVKYVNKPPLGKKPTDVITSATVIFSF